MKRGAFHGGLCTLATVLALTACSSSPSSKSGNSGTSGPGGTDGGATGSRASGSPINLAFLTEFSSPGTSGDGYAGIQAAIKYVNAHGGVKGRPLAATVCVDNDSPNLAEQCATKAANDSSVIATVGQTTLQAASVDPVLEHATLPAIGAQPVVAADFASPMIFACTIGGLAGLGATAAVADLLHGKKVSVVYVQSPAAATISGLINSVVMGPRKLSNVTAVGVSPMAGDLSAAVAKANEGHPDGIVLYTGQAQANSFVKAARQQGVKTPILISASVESPSAIKQQLGDGSGLYFYTFFNHSGTFYDNFLNQWKAAGEDPNLADESSINGWLAVTMFADVARTLPSVTRTSVVAAFNKLHNYDTKGLIPPVSFDTPGTGLGGKAPRVVNLTVGLSQYQDGKLVPYANGKTANPFVP
jgi:ABC-type branched-subunit amino acid transport system substrate-binding protein